ncbi:MAG: lipopolysaccharide heptosyltransferase I [Planctomycetia bacterium]
MDAPRAVVCVKLSAIGDVLHGVPAAVAIKKAFPNTRVGWVVEGRAADVLAGHPAIDHLFRLPRGWMKSWQAIRALRRQLLDFRADVAIDMQGLLKSAVPTWLSAARVRIGHARPESREAAWLAYTHAVPTTAAHVVDRNCDLLAPLGVREPSPSFAMPDWPVSRRRMEEWLATLRLGSAPALVNPGAGWPSKIWPEERFAAVARALFDRHGMTSVVVWGGDRERASAERIAAAAPRATVVAPQTSLQDLAALARLARLFISGDTGPLHLAAAVGTPCVGLFGPVPADRNGPYGRIHATVEPPAELRPKWEDRKTDTLAMAGIEVDRVVAACERLAFHGHRITA